MERMLDRVWPAGTMVVARVPITPVDGGPPRPRGACDLILQSPQTPTGSYRIRFMDGTKTPVAAEHLDVLKHYQEGDIGDTEQLARQHDLHQHIIYSCIVGSRLWLGSRGLRHGSSRLLPAARRAALVALWRPRAARTTRRRGVLLGA
jgi:hypothetical protein